MLVSLVYGLDDANLCWRLTRLPHPPQKRLSVNHHEQYRKHWNERFGGGIINLLPPMIMKIWFRLSAKISDGISRFPLLDSTCSVIILLAEKQPSHMVVPPFRKE